MSEGGFDAFGRRFSASVLDWKDELLTLEREGALYEHWILDDENGGPGIYRVQLQPDEIYGYVSALVAWDEFLDGGLDAVSDRELAASAESNAAERRKYNEGWEGLCAADFMGQHVEALGAIPTSCGCV